MKMTEIDSYIGLQKELTDQLSHISQDALERMNKLTFAIIGPDAITSERIPRILDHFERNNIHIVRCKYLPVVSEKQIEELYKYSVPDAVKTMPHYLESDCSLKSHCPYMSFIPTRNWRILRRKFSLGPSVALILRSDSYETAKKVKTVKGPTDPLLCHEGQIRKETDNPAFSMIHSADDTASVARESILFFGVQTLSEILEMEDPPPVTREIFTRNTKIILPDQEEFRFSVIALVTRLRLLIQQQLEWTSLFSFYLTWLNRFKEIRLGKDLLKSYTAFVKEEQKKFSVVEVPESVHSLLLLLNSSETGRELDVERLFLLLRLHQVYMSEREKLVLESGLWYYREVE